MQRPQQGGENWAARRCLQSRNSGGSKHLAQKTLQTQTRCFLCLLLTKLSHPSGGLGKSHEVLSQQKILSINCCLVVRGSCPPFFCPYCTTVQLYRSRMRSRWEKADDGHNKGLATRALHGVLIYRHLSAANKGATSTGPLCYCVPQQINCAWIAHRVCTWTCCYGFRRTLIRWFLIHD